MISIVVLGMAVLAFDDLCDEGTIVDVGDVNLKQICEPPSKLTSIYPYSWAYT
jgi:hypothetical protein